MEIWIIGNITAKSGNINVGNGNELTAKTSSGNIKTGDILIGVLDASSGNITVGNIGEAKVSVASGNIKVEKTNRITAKTTSGGISINSIDSFCDLECKSGSVKIERCNLNENSSIHTTSGGVNIKETNDIYIDAKVSSGDIKVENNNRLSEIELKIETTSGGIKVNN